MPEQLAHRVDRNNRVDTTGLDKERLEGSDFAVLAAVYKGEQPLLGVRESLLRYAEEWVRHRRGIESDTGLWECLLQALDDRADCRGLQRVFLQKHRMNDKNIKSRVVH